MMLPSGLKSLAFGYLFNQSLSKVTLDGVPVHGNLSVVNISAGFGCAVVTVTTPTPVTAEACRCVCRLCALLLPQHRLHRHVTASAELCVQRHPGQVLCGWLCPPQQMLAYLLHFLALTGVVVYDNSTQLWWQDFDECYCINAIVGITGQN